MSPRRSLRPRRTMPIQIPQTATGPTDRSKAERSLPVRHRLRHTRPYLPFRQVQASVARAGT